MATWLVRADREGEGRERLAVGGRFVCISWDWLPDLSDRSESAIARLLSEHPAYASSPARLVTEHAGEIHTFAARIQVDDYALLPFRDDPERVAIGRVAERYRFLKDSLRGPRHVIPVQWLSENYSRHDLPEALQAGLRFRATVSRLVDLRPEALGLDEPDSRFEVQPLRPTRAAS